MTFDPKDLGYLSALERAQWLNAGGTGWWMPSYAYDPRTGNLLFRQGDSYGTLGEANTGDLANRLTDFSAYMRGLNIGGYQDQVAAAQKWLQSNQIVKLPSAIGSGGVGEQLRLPGDSLPYTTEQGLKPDKPNLGGGMGLAFMAIAASMLLGRKRRR